MPNTIIYALEGLESNLRTRLLQPLDAGEFIAVTSQITLVGTIVGTRRKGDSVAEKEMRALLTPTDHLLVEPISLAILEKLIDIRGKHSFKVPDAIHLATGLKANVDLFVTADKAWSKLGVTVVNPSEIS